MKRKCRLLALRTSESGTTPSKAILKLDPTPSLNCGGSDEDWSLMTPRKRFSDQWVWLKMVAGWVKSLCPVEIKAEWQQSEHFQSLLAHKWLDRENSVKKRKMSKVWTCQICNVIILVSKKTYSDTCVGQDDSNSPRVRFTLAAPALPLCLKTCRSG